MRAPSSDDDSWFVIDVDGEPFEWRVIEAVAMQSDGRPAHVRRRSPGAWKERVLCVRRPNDDVHSFGIVKPDGEPIDEAAVREDIRTFRETTSLARDYRVHEAIHARELAMYWSRLPASAQRELARAWLKRSGARCGVPLDVDDDEDLREIGTKALVAARRLSVADGDDEAAAQERDVHEAFEKHVGSP